MRQYYKAYYLRDLQGFSEWSQQCSDSGTELADDTICYLGDDFVVVLSLLQDQKPLFDAITPAWQEFCRTTLEFVVPDGLGVAESQSVESASAVPV